MHFWTALTASLFVAPLLLPSVSAVPSKYYPNGVFDAVLNPRNNPVANAKPRPALRDVKYVEREVQADAAPNRPMRPRSTSTPVGKYTFAGCFCSNSCREACYTAPFTTLDAAEAYCIDNGMERDVGIVFQASGNTFRCSGSPQVGPFDCNGNSASLCGGELPFIQYYYAPAL